MNDLLRTGIGGERGDQTLKASNAVKPLWTLVPLPLSQVNSAAVAPAPVRGHAKSLQHSCLTVLSRNFHLYTPSSFEGVSKHYIRRVIHRVKHDRQYDGQDTSLRPDAATIWAFSLLLDPEVTSAAHTLALPVDITLAHLKPQPTLPNPLHPFIELPKLYRDMDPSSSLELITTLHLDGLNDAVNDHTVTALRWATHLTVLKMTGCRRVTDAGIRLMASALNLPGDTNEEERGKGMWRLRAWYLDGCKEIGDKSMPLFARWPGLVLLDLRNTSCTSSAIDVFNRNNEALYTGQLAVMQNCSSGLLALFSRKSSTAVQVDRLAKTVLAPDAMKQPLPYRTLNIIPSRDMPPAEYLPDPTPLTANDTKHGSFREGANYMIGGVGQIYGSGVERITDEGRAFRRDVRTALYMQALDDGLCQPEKRVSLLPSKAEKEAGKKDSKTWTVHKAGKTYKLKKEDEDRSKRFVTASTTAAVAIRVDDEIEHVKAEPGLMLVRVSQEGWDRLSWSLHRPMAVVSTPKPKGDIITELLSLSQKAEPQPRIKGKAAAAPASQLFRATPSTPAIAPSGSGVDHTLRTKPSQLSDSRISSPNPFSQAGTIRNSFGIKPLPRAMMPDMTASTGMTDGFATTGRKRTWGAGPDEPSKRRGMKMFSGARM